MNAMSFGAVLTAGASPLVWVVVKTKQGLERQAERGLRGLGIETYLPLMLYESRAVKARGDRPGSGPEVLMSRPFFPCYLFARVPARIDQWRGIFSTHGVAGVLGCTQTRALGLADYEIERLRVQEEGGYLKIAGMEPLRQNDSKQFKRGEAVRVYGLPDMEATFLEPVDAKRVAILLKLLGKESRSVVDLAKLLPRQS